MDKSQAILSDIVTYLKYAKYNKENKRRETWDEIIDRYINMMYKRYPTVSSDITKYAPFIYNKKVLPSMRMLQFSGDAVEKNHSRGYNCSYLPVDDFRAFPEIMFLLLGGCGVGFSVQKRHVANLPPIIHTMSKERRFLISDSIEGWADAIKALMKFYFGMTKSKPRFDYSDIRVKGARLVTAGGKAPGPEPLRICITKIEALLRGKENGSQLSTLECHDIICHIADAVLAGGIRRAALISLFSMDDTEMLTCKHGSWWELNPQRGRSNNSAMIVRNRIEEDEFKNIWGIIQDSKSGEPGVAWTNDPEQGFNPCMEISLRPFSFCNLTEINGGDVESQEDFNIRCEAASFFGTLQAGFTDFHYLREVWRANSEKDALVGVGITGIGDGKLTNINLKESANIVKRINAATAGAIGINSAARTTTVKPSGCSVGSTMLITSEGLLTLEEIGDVNGEDWQNHSIEVSQEFSMEKSDKFYVNGKVDTKKIYTSGGIELESSLTHQYKVLRGGEYVWVKTPELVIGDVLPFKVGGYAGGSIQKLDSFVQKNTLRLSPITQPELLNDDIAWLLGLYLADGSTHKKGIRIAGDIKKKDILEKANSIVLKYFNISGIIYDRTKGNNSDLYINSQSLLKWLKLNNLVKQKTLNIEIPLIIRKSPKNIIKSYIDGYGMGDGSIKTNGRTFCTISKKMASQLVIILRAIGIDAKCRLMPPTDTSYGTNMRYWISERKGRESDNRYIRKITKDIWEQLDELGLVGFNFDTVVDIRDGFENTYDISVPKGNTYIAESYVNHNTSSLVLGTASGVHAYHSPYYIRNLQCGVGDDLYNYFMDNHPQLIKVMDYDPKSAVIGIPQKAPDTAILRGEESAIDFLNRVKRFNLEWVKVGHRRGPNTNNVSATCNVKSDEWDDVGDWMWKNNKSYNGMSVLPYDDHTYKDAPFTECTEKEYLEKYEYLQNINLKLIVEEEDNTALIGEVACGGGSCEVK